MNIFILAMIGLATLILTVGHAGQSLWNVAIIISVVGLLWLVGQWRGRTRVASLGFTFFVGVTMYGVFHAVPLAWLLPGTLTTLVAWDLTHFNSYLSSVTDVRNEADLKRRHFLRLGVAIGLGLLLSAVASDYQTELNFIWAILLGLLAIVGLSQVVRFLRQESD